MRKLFFFNNVFEVCIIKWYNYYLMPLFRNVKRFNTQKLEKIAFWVLDTGFLYSRFTVAEN